MLKWFEWLFCTLFYPFLGLSLPKKRILSEEEEEEEEEEEGRLGNFEYLVALRSKGGVMCDEYHGFFSGMGAEILK